MGKPTERICRILTQWFDDHSMFHYVYHLARRLMDVRTGIGVLRKAWIDLFI